LQNRRRRATVPERAGQLSVSYIHEQTLLSAYRPRQFGENRTHLVPGDTITMDAPDPHVRMSPPGMACPTSRPVAHRVNGHTSITISSMAKRSKKTNQNLNFKNASEATQNQLHYHNNAEPDGVLTCSGGKANG
jgi:hypothetical protein